MPTTWKIYDSNPALWDDMLEACKNATKSIDLEQFIFVNDEIGKRFIQICTEKVKQGVRVRFLFDDAGSFSLLGAFLLTDLSRRGIQISFFNTILPRSIDNHRWWFFRNHRRSLIIDSKSAFTGSQCIWGITKDWHDLNIRLEGAIVANIEKSFEIMWSRAHNVRVPWGVDMLPSSDGFAYVTNAPIKGKQFMYHHLIDVLRAAKSYIYIITPYFVPDRRLIRVIRLAARRGVDVRMIFPKYTDHPVVDLGSHSFYASLMKNGVKVYIQESLNNNTLPHAKVAVVDGEWATVGTMNLDHISLKYNFEANVVGTDVSFVSEIHQYCKKEMQASKQLDPTLWERRNPAQKWLEFLTRFIRKAL